MDRLDESRVGSHVEEQRLVVNPERGEKEVSLRVLGSFEDEELVRDLGGDSEGFKQELISVVVTVFWGYGDDRERLDLVFIESVSSFELHFDEHSELIKHGRPELVNRLVPNLF